MEEIQSTPLPPIDFPPTQQTHSLHSTTAEVPMQCYGSFSDLCPFGPIFSLAHRGQKYARKWTGQDSVKMGPSPPPPNNNSPTFCIDCQMNERFTDSHKRGPLPSFLPPKSPNRSAVRRPAAGSKSQLGKMEFRRDTFDCRDIIVIIKYSVGRRGGRRRRRRRFLPHNTERISTTNGILGFFSPRTLNAQ